MFEVQSFTTLHTHIQYSLAHFLCLDLCIWFDWFYTNTKSRVSNMKERGYISCVENAYLSNRSIRPKAHQLSADVSATQTHLILLDFSGSLPMLYAKRPLFCVDRCSIWGKKKEKTLNWRHKLISIKYCCGFLKFRFNCIACLSIKTSRELTIGQRAEGNQPPRFIK